MTDIQEAKHIVASDMERAVHLSSDDMFDEIMKQTAIANDFTLHDAMVGTTCSKISGALQTDTLPDTPNRLINSGLFPPTEDSEIVLKRVQNMKFTERVTAMGKKIQSGWMTLADTKGYRVRTAYRLIRHMARIRGFLDGWGQLMDGYMDPAIRTMWILPMNLGRPMEHHIIGYRGVRTILEDMDRCRDGYTYLTTGGFKTYTGVSTLPPPIPDRFFVDEDGKKLSYEQIWDCRTMGIIPDGYDPKKDLQLCLYCESMATLAHQMGIEYGAPEEPWSGIYGLAGLMNPYMARQAWPTRDELLMYEAEMLHFVFEKVSENSEFKTQRYMQDFFGYTRFEAIDTVKTAIKAGGMLYAERVEERKATMIKKIEILVDKNQDIDPRMALAGFKLISQISGLTIHNEDDSMEALKNSVIDATGYPGKELGEVGDEEYPDGE